MASKACLERQKPSLMACAIALALISATTGSSEAQAQQTKATGLSADADAARLISQAAELQRVGRYADAERV